MEVYISAAESDALLLGWWKALKESGDLLHIFSVDMHTPAGFLAGMQLPVALLYEVCNGALCRAVWFTPLMNSLSVGMWAHAEHRGANSVKFLKDALTAAYLATPLTVIVANRPEVREATRWFGYLSLGVVPYVYNGHDGEVFYMTRERFKELHGNG
jgi:hypothetical protein